MPRLQNKATGTVVRCEGNLAAYYLSAGWVDLSAQRVEVLSEKPLEVKRGPGRPKKK